MQLVIEDGRESAEVASERTEQQSDESRKSHYFSI